MSSTVIEVENLGKRYQLGQSGSHQSTLRETLSGVARSSGRGLARTFRRPDAPDEAAMRRQFWALRNVSFDIQRGEVLGIVGRNGAGKSTLLKLMSQITQPTEGCIRTRGRVASLLEVGTGFHPELTGRENVLLNGAILGMSKGEILRKFDDIVEFAEVERFIDTPVKRYSSGMYLRLAFAVAAHLEPEILMVDEVLAVGDAAFQQRCLGKMGSIAGEGRTVLLVTHNMAAVKQLCNRALFIDAGSLVFDGDVDGAVSSYLRINRSSGPTVDLTSFDNPFGHGELRVPSISIDDPRKASFAVAWDEPLRVRVRVDAVQAVRDVSVAIGIQTTDGFPLFTVRSADQDDAPFSLSPGESVEVTGTIKHSLRAGHYNVVLGVHTGNYVYYYNPTAAPLEVSDIGTSPYLYRNTGAVNCAADWRVLR